MPHTFRTQRRTNTEYRWSRPRIHLFLRVLAASGSVAAAARVVGVSRQSAYRLRRRLGAGFAEFWDEGLRVGAEMRREGLRYDAQGDRWVPQGDTSGAQGDTFAPQGDTDAPQSDTERHKVTGFSQERVTRVTRRAVRDVTLRAAPPRSETAARALE